MYTSFQSYARQWLFVTILVATGLSLSACEPVSSVVQPSQAQVIGLPTTALDHPAQAETQRLAGDHAGCAHSFAAAARSESPQDRGQHWYQAARCAARAGDFLESRFHLQAAASDGFSELQTLLADPLFRPMHSGSRWQLVVDQVSTNLGQKPHNDVLPAQQERMAGPCQMMHGLRERLLPALQLWVQVGRA